MHIDFFGKKVSKTIAIIRKARHIVNGDALLILYDAIQSTHILLSALKYGAIHIRPTYFLCLQNRKR